MPKETPKRSAISSRVPSSASYANSIRSRKSSDKVFIRPFYHSDEMTATVLFNML